jgi:hypothetical protein
MDETKKMPRCLGSFEPDDSQCDGSVVGKTEEDRTPCAYRDRCVGFQKLLADSGRPQEFFVRLVELRPSPKAKLRQYKLANSEGFQDQLSEQIHRWGIRNGRVTRKAPPPRAVAKKYPRRIPPAALETARQRKLTKQQKRAAHRGRTVQASSDQSKTTELIQWFMKRLSEETGRKVADVDAAARPGQLFIVDRLEKSNYIAVYCRLPQRKQQAIASAYRRAALGSLEIRVACSFPVYEELLAAADAAKLAPTDYTGKDGAFKVRIRGVDKERASIVAESIAKAIRRKVLALP